MNQVKVQWVHDQCMYNEKSLNVLLQTLPDIKPRMVPVIPLSALTEVVEGTGDYILGYADALRDLKRLLAMLEVDK